MQANFSDKLRRVISHEHLDAYRHRGTSNDDAELFAHYAWNGIVREQIIEAIAWVNPVMMAFVEQLDRFEGVYKDGIDEYRKIITSRLAGKIPWTTNTTS